MPTSSFFGVLSGPLTFKLIPTSSESLLIGSTALLSTFTLIPASDVSPGVFSCPQQAVRDKDKANTMIRDASFFINGLLRI